MALLIWVSLTLRGPLADQLCSAQKAHVWDWKAETLQSVFTGGTCLRHTAIINIWNWVFAKMPEMQHPSKNGLHDDETSLLTSRLWPSGGRVLTLQSWSCSLFWYLEISTYCEVISAIWWEFTSSIQHMERQQWGVSMRLLPANAQNCVLAALASMLAGCRFANVAMVYGSTLFHPVFLSRRQ